MSDPTPRPTTGPASASPLAAGAAPVDAPRGEPLRVPSRMPRPLTGLRRVDHPDPSGLPPPEVKVVSGWRVSCDGGEGALGHPRVWLSIPHEQGFVDCGYCDARFLHERFAGGPAGMGQDPGTVDPGAPADHTQPADVAKDETTSRAQGGA